MRVIRACVRRHHSEIGSGPQRNEVRPMKRRPLSPTSIYPPPSSSTSPPLLSASSLPSPSPSPTTSTMSVLHTYFHRRDQQAFQRALDASIKALAAPEPRPSTSAGRSLSTSPHIAHAATGLDVNARDALGRTVLHLACASTHPSAPTYVRLLLAHPHIQPNAQDAESHWTPLHRAMYHGNLASALLLLQRGDVDVSIKDWEGYTAYDVWNSSIDGTKPARIPRRDMIDEDWDEIEAEMYVWGSNRNAGLGVGDGDDRAFPEVVQFDKVRVGRTVDERFRPTKVHGLAMARFHTGA